MAKRATSVRSTWGMKLMKVFIARWEREVAARTRSVLLDASSEMPLLNPSA